MNFDLIAKDGFYECSAGVGEHLGCATAGGDVLGLRARTDACRRRAAVAVLHVHAHADDTKRLRRLLVGDSPETRGYCISTPTQQLPPDFLANGKLLLPTDHKFQHSEVP